MIRLNVFADAFSKVPQRQDDLTWPELCDTLETLVQTTAAAKTSLPAITLGTLAEPYNVNANYLDHTALVIDVDRVDLHALITIAEARELSAFIYGSPSDDADGDPFARRVRVIVELTAPLHPDHVRHCRLALAELLGIGPGQGVETAIAVSQIMFVGRLEGTPERDCFRLEGIPLDEVALSKLPLREQWKKAPKTSTAEPRARVATADPDECTAALLEALAPYWEAPGEASGRRQILRGLGGYLAKRGWHDDQIAAVARALSTERPEATRVELMLECARQARRAPTESAGWSTLTEWNPEAAAAIESVAKDPREPDGFAGVWSERWAKIEERAATRKRAAAPAEPFTAAGADEPDAPASVPVFLCSRDGHVTLMWEGDEYGHRPIAERRIRLRVRELGYDTSMVELYGKGGKPVSVDTILEGHSESYEHTAYAFANTVTQYDPSGTGRVTIGYPHVALEGRYDADADAWLRALGGQHYDRLAVWIASCSQAHINRLSACLILIGEKDVGKSMFGHAVAALWGQDPPPLALVNVQFNADLRRCPILVDEEAQLFGSKQLSSKKFRDIIQERSRSFELKGKERAQLHGALRAIVSCNGYSDLRFTDLGGPAVIGALRDRLLVIDALKRSDECAAPLARLRVAGDHVVDLARIAAHMAWLCETVELPAERFLGAGGDDSEGAVLAGHVDEHIDLWESFRDWLEGTSEGGPWYASAKHGLCADTGALALSLENTGRGWEHRQVRAALAPFHTADVRLRLPDNARPRVWVIDALRIAEALQLDLETLGALERRLAAAEQPRSPGGRFGRFRG